VHGKAGLCALHLSRRLCSSRSRIAQYNTYQHYHRQTSPARAVSLKSTSDFRHTFALIPEPNCSRHHLQRTIRPHRKQLANTSSRWKATLRLLVDIFPRSPLLCSDDTCDIDTISASNSGCRISVGFSERSPRNLVHGDLDTRALELMRGQGSLIRGRSANHAQSLS